MSQKAIVDLSGATPFAEGDNRWCFRHPEQPNRCLKVMKPGVAEALYEAMPLHKKIRGRDSADDNLREARGYAQTAISRASQSAWEHLPRWHGRVQTSLGMANETDLIQDAGQPAGTLEELLRETGLSQEVLIALQDFGNWLTGTGILSRNLLPHNLVVQRQANPWRIYLIDGLGAPPTQDLLCRMPAYRRRYLGRRLKKMWARCEWEASGRKGHWSEVEKRV